ncbi:MAG: hypothetical protein WBX15_06720 [Thermoanaerobaculia bacterium]
MLFVLLISTAAASLLAQTPPKIHVTVLAHATPREQLTYSQGLARKYVASSGEAKTIAFAETVLNLEYVQRAWPDDRPAVAESYLQLAKFYSTATMYEEALEKVRTGKAMSPDDPRFGVVEAKALRDLGRGGEGDRTMDEVAAKIRDSDLSTIHGRAVLQDAALYYQSRGEYGKAASALRRVAHAMPRGGSRLSILMAIVEAEEHAHPGAPPTDAVRQLRHAYTELLGTNLTPDETEYLSQVEVFLREHSDH